VQGFLTAVGSVLARLRHHDGGTGNLEPDDRNRPVLRGETGGGRYQLAWIRRSHSGSGTEPGGDGRDPVNVAGVFSVPGERRGGCAPHRATMDNAAGVCWRGDGRDWLDFGTVGGSNSVRARDIHDGGHANRRALAAAGATSASLLLCIAGVCEFALEFRSVPA